MMGGAVFVSAGQSIFSNTLLKSIANSGTGLDPLLVIQTGSSEIRTVFSSTQLDTVLEGYMNGFKDTFAFGIALSGVAVLMALAPPMKSIKGKVELKDLGSSA
jgi:hypothetical protein